jgi:hypothetical protein
LFLTLWTSDSQPFKEQCPLLVNKIPQAPFKYGITTLFENYEKKYTSVIFICERNLTSNNTSFAVDVTTFLLILVTLGLHYMLKGHLQAFPYTDY